MKQTIGPMLCKLNTAQATIPELAERKAAEEAEKRRAAEAQRKAKERLQQKIAAAAAAAVPAPKKKRNNVLAELFDDVGWWLFHEHSWLVFFAVIVALIYGFFRIPALWNPATCTEGATSVVISSLKNPFMPALGHDYVVPVCETCGKHHDGNEDHYWDCANCTTPVTCSRCGAEDTANPFDRVRHQWTRSADETKICELCGARTLAVGERSTEEIDGRTLFMLELELPLAEQTRIGFRVYSRVTPGDWTVYVMTAEGAYHAVGTITVAADPDFDDGKVIERDYIVTLSEPLAVKGVGIAMDGTFSDDSSAEVAIDYIGECP